MHITVNIIPYIVNNILIICIFAENLHIYKKKMIKLFITLSRSGK